MESRILIVDDSDFELDMMHEVFQTVDPEVVVDTATGGDEALERLRTADHLPRVVLLDLRMPGMNGIQVLRKIKADPHLKRMPVCAFSNGDVPQDICACYDEGASFYFKKPTGLANLRSFAQCFVGLWFQHALSCEAP